jgi:chromosome partitioning protein
MEGMMDIWVGESEKRKMGKIYHSQPKEGGVGKTTTTASFAWRVWLLMGFRTLIVVHRPISRYNWGLIYNPRRIENSIYGVWLMESLAQDIIIATDLPYLHIIPSHIVW